MYLFSPLRAGNWSWRMVTTVSVVEIWVPKPSRSSIRKKSTAQTGDTGILVTASGYAMKARPGPWVTTSWSIFKIEIEVEFLFFERS